MKRRPLHARLKRAFQELLGGNSEFNGSDFNRFVYDWATSCLAPDDEIKRSIRVLRSRARDLSRNSGYAKKFLRLLTANVIGRSGMKLQAEVRDGRGELREDVNDAIEAAWTRWASAPVTVDGRLNLVQLERLALKTTATDGELLVQLVPGFRNEFRFALQPHDADLLDEKHVTQRGPNTPEIRMGVEVDEWAAPTGYWLLDRPAFGGLRRERHRVPAERMLHCFVGDRLNQTRGTSWFHGALMSLRMLVAYQEAELVASRLGANHVGVIEPPADQPGTTEQQGSAIFDSSPGSYIRLGPGEKLNPWAPSHPNTAYAEFVKNILREVADWLGVDYTTFANDLEGVNFSSIRAGLLAERDIWVEVQDWWAFDFRRRIYQAWLNAALTSGVIEFDSNDWRDYATHRWIARGWDWVDPQKDANADMLGIHSGLSSRQQILAEKGMNFWDVMEDLKEEEDEADRLGLDISGPKPAQGATPDASADEDDEDDEKTVPKPKKARRSRVLSRLAGARVGRNGAQ